MRRREFLAHSVGTSGLTIAAGEALANHSSPEPYAQSSSFARDVSNPAYIDPRLDCRSVSFENPTGERGAGGQAANGRKGRPMRYLAPGEKSMLAELTGSGTLRHFWTMLSGLPPEIARALRLEIFYDGLAQPSVSVPLLDFFALPHGRCVEFYSALITVNEGRGLNSYIPIPFGRSIRVELTNESSRHVELFYQIDYTLEHALPKAPSYLHAGFRRENPTTLKRDFVIVEGLKGPGRFLGCSIGIRLLDRSTWYGEGEVKIYRDGDQKFPTYCGTGLEDYVGSAYGLGRHSALYGGAPMIIPDVRSPPGPGDEGPQFVSFFRWHLPDPVMFSDELLVTIQQVGIKGFKKGQEAKFEAFKKNNVAAGHGWLKINGEANETIGFGLYERVDDYCATAFVYCRNPQPVSRYETRLAVKDIALLPTEPKPTNSATELDEQFALQVKEILNEG